MNAIFLCCKLEAELTEGSLTSLINNHSQLSILIKHKCAYFSSADPAVLAILIQELTNGVYPEFSKDFYQMLAETEDQISKVSADSVRISCKDDIFLYFQEKILKTEALQEAENQVNAETKEAVKFDQKNEMEEKFNHIPINATPAKDQLTNVQTEKQIKENRELEYVQNINLQFCEEVQNERSFLNTSLLAKQTKIQAIQSNVQQSLKFNPTKNQNFNPCDKLKIELIEYQKGLLLKQKSQANQIEVSKKAQILQNKRRDHLNLGFTVQKHEAFAIVKQEKAIITSQIKVQPFLPIDNKENRSQIDSKFEFKEKIINAKMKQSELGTVKPNKQNLIIRKNMFIVLFLIIWLIVLLMLYL